MTRRDEPRAILERLLANGPVTGWPRRPADAALLVRIAATRLAPGRDYREAEVNAALREWLATFSDEHGIDHVTLRRELVDAGFLARDKSGALYRLAEGRLAELEPLRDLDLAAMLIEAHQAREARKRASRERGIAS
jgi:hypothetical protein